MTSPILKVSVLSSGAVLLDGTAISPEELGARLESLRPHRPVIWYYREAAAGEPPPQAMQVMKVVADRRLPISLCSKADFSDYVDRKGVSHPRYTTWEAVFEKVREKTAGGRYIGVIRPDLSYLLMAPPLRDSVQPQMIRMMEKMIPPRPPRNVSAIADTYFSMKAGGGIPSLAETGQEIPFFGMLLGMACIGHSVCVFPGTGNSLAAGCKGADLLIVDDAQLSELGADWKAAASGAMRGANIVVHERASFKLTSVQAH